MKIETLVLGKVMTNCYIIYNEGSDEAVLIDPAAEGEKIKRALGERKVAAILLTHGHFDHTGALRDFPGVPVYIHPADDIMLKDPAWHAGGMVGDREARPDATDYVQEGTRLYLADLPIRVLHVPGHTKGSVAYEIENALFTGDTLFYRGFGRTDLPGGSMAEEMKSVKRLLRLEKDLMVFPGHGDPTTLKAEREYYL